VNGGASWSSWYNQPTAQMFHVQADNAFPYRLCGGQQESGSGACPRAARTARITLPRLASRGSGGVRIRRPDPLDPTWCTAERSPVGSADAAAPGDRAGAVRTPAIGWSARSRCTFRQPIRARSTSPRTPSGRPATAGAAGSRSAGLTRRPGATAERRQVSGSEEARPDPARGHYALALRARTAG